MKILFIHPRHLNRRHIYTSPVGGPHTNADICICIQMSDPFYREGAPPRLRFSTNIVDEALLQIEYLTLRQSCQAKDVAPVCVAIVFDSRAHSSVKHQYAGATLQLCWCLFVYVCVFIAFIVLLASGSSAIHLRFELICRYSSGLHIYFINIYIFRNLYIQLSSSFQHLCSTFDFCLAFYGIPQKYKTHQKKKSAQTHTNTRTNISQY